MPLAIDIKQQLSMRLNKSLVFAIDTNVLLWFFYSAASYAQDYRSKYYSGFIADLIGNNNKLIITTINLNEMFHVIEKNECDIYYQTKKKDTDHRATRDELKQFRQIEVERNKVKRELQLILKQLQTIPQINIVSIPIHIDLIEAFCTKYSEHCCDFFDFALIEHCNNNNFSIITDDIDFCTSLNSVPIYTANRKLIDSINQQPA